MTHFDLYESAPFFMARTALLPFHMASRLDQAMDAKRELLELYHQHGTFQEAIAIASPALHQALKKVGNFPSPTELNKIYPSLLKYFLRMLSRTTPFGLFSCVSWGEFAEKTALHISLASLKKKVKPDMAWMQSMIKFMHEQTDLMKNTKVMANPSLLKKGKKFYLTKKSEDADARNEISIKSTAASEAILLQARQPISYSRLEEEISLLFHQHDRKKIASCIEQIFQKEFLLSELSIAMDEPFSLSEWMKKISKSLEQHPTIWDTLIQVECALSHYEACPISQGLPLLEEAFRSLNQWKEVEYPIQVDTFVETSTIQLNEAIQEKISQAGTAIWLLSHQQKPTSPLHKYHREFLEKYGISRCVPLLELLHDVKGLGLPVIEAEGAKKDHLFSLKEKLLSNILEKEIVIDDLIPNLWSNAQEELQNAPLSLELYFEIIAHSAQEIDDGHFSIVMNPVVATTQAGSTFGRFLHLWNDHPSMQSDQLQKFLSKEEALYPQAAFVEASFLPENPRTANICFFKKVRHFQMQMHYQGSADQCIQLDDIWVGATPQRLYLYSKSLNQEIYVRLSSAVNPDLAPPLLKFLLEASQLRFSHFSPYLWGGSLQNSSHLPRIKYLNIILSPERWYFNYEQLGLKKNATSKMVESTLEKALQKAHVPDCVYLTYFDHRLFIKWSHPDSFQLICHHLITKGELILFECLTGHQPPMQSEEGFHAVEFVVPLIKKEQYFIKNDVQNFPSASMHPIQARVSAFQRKWLYAKLYLPKEGEEEFLIHYLHPFMNSLMESKSINQWFYIRYQEDKPHIRLRLLSESDALFASLMDHFFQWGASLLNHEVLSNFSTHLYEREIERYGGLACIGEAESLFFADSEYCCQILNIFNVSKINLPLYVLAAFGIIHFLKQFDGNLSSMIHFLAPMSAENALLTGFREQAKESLLYAQQLFFKENAQGNQSNVFLLQLEECFSHLVKPIENYRDKVEELERQNALENTKEQIIDSILHMHCNRLLGTDSQLEKKARVIALHLLKRMHYQKQAVKT